MAEKGSPICDILCLIIGLDIMTEACSQSHTWFISGWKCLSSSLLIRKPPYVQQTFSHKKIHVNSNNNKLLCPGGTLISKTTACLSAGCHFLRGPGGAYALRGFGLGAQNCMLNNQKSCFWPLIYINNLFGPHSLKTKCQTLIRTWVTALLQFFSQINAEFLDLFSITYPDDTSTERPLIMNGLESLHYFYNPLMLTVTKSSFWVWNDFEFPQVIGKLLYNDWWAPSSWRSKSWALGG